MTHDEHGHDHGAHGFWRTYVFSTDHKMIGKQFLFGSIFFGFVGGLLAMLFRWQLAWPNDPEHPVPILSKALWDGNPMPPEFYNMAVTMHATVMVFFFIIPMLVGAFGNFAIPLQIGARDMAFPKLNMASFWTYVVAGLIMLASFVVEGGAAQGGWTGYPPLSSIHFQPGWGVNLWILSLATVGAASIMGAVNYVTTILNMRAPGLSLFRLPLFIWTQLVTAALNVLAVPVLTAGALMLLFDRTLGTSFYLPGGLRVSGEVVEGISGGGQVILWQHLFWYFGHPEVYIIVLPGMGVASELIATFSRKPIFGYHSMVWAIVAIGGLSFVVWGHHMFTSGMNPLLGTGFMLTTVVIAVPSAIKTFNWLGTLWRGNLRYTAPMLCGLGFVSMFVLGGLSGIFLAATPVDIYVHDTYFVVAHFHYVAVSAALFAIFGGIYYWFPKMFGRRMNETLAKIHVVLTFVFVNLTFGPMHFLGIGGHMRRIADPTVYAHIRPAQEWNLYITMFAFSLFLAQLVFVANFVWALARGRKAEENPWEANTLEWAAPTPPPHGNFPGPIPEVRRGPYEYSAPGTPARFGDHWPQWEPGPDPALAHAPAQQQE